MRSSRRIADDSEQRQVAILILVLDIRVVATSGDSQTVINGGYNDLFHLHGDAANTTAILDEPVLFRIGIRRGGGQSGNDVSVGEDHPAVLGHDAAAAEAALLVVLPGAVVFLLLDERGEQ